MALDYEKSSFMELGYLLQSYYQGIPLQDEYIDKIAQATESERIMAMAQYNAQRVGLNGGEAYPQDYYERLGAAMLKLYYGDSAALTKDELLLIAMATDEQKLSALHENSLGRGEFSSNANRLFDYERRQEGRSR